ncbi:uncharacterized protein DS421_8g226730 [Arachis hypogaea]|nr:uncharacterized protein DS421_8g226730 [Arachis hypogaea]
MTSHEALKPGSPPPSLSLSLSLSHKRHTTLALKLLTPTPFLSFFHSQLTSVHRHHRTLAAVAAPLAGSFDSCSRASPLSSVCAWLLRLPPPVSAPAVRVCCCSSSVVVSARLSRTAGVSSFVFLVAGVSRPFLGASSPAAEATRGAVASFVAFRGVVAVDRDRW